MPNIEPNIFITGLGLVTSLGTSAWSTFRALLEGRTIAGRCAAMPDDIEAAELVRSVGSVSFAQASGTDPVVDIISRAIAEATSSTTAASHDAPIMLGISKGATHALLAAAGPDTSSHRRGGLIAQPPADASLAVVLGPQGYVAHHLRQRFASTNIRTVIAACASSLTALHMARRQMLREDGPKCMIVATAEASLMPMFVHSYRRLGVLPRLTPHTYSAQPLDENRSGFMLAEMGAAVVLERRDNEAAESNMTELLNTAIACDAHDIIRPCPEHHALHRVADTLLADQSIDLLHPHATGTIENDAAELAALRHHTTCEVYACKGAIGHGLGASGLASLVIAALCGRTRKRPPMPWLSSPIANVSAQQGEPLPSSSTHAIFSAGFGGHVAGCTVRHHA